MSPASQSPFDLPGDLLLNGIGTVFESLGRGLICLDKDLQIVHVSAGLGRLLGPGSVENAIGKPVEEVLGVDLFGPDASLRKALLSGERREGWGATIQRSNRQPRLVSVTAAPISDRDDAVCDPRVSFIVVVRPADEDHGAGSSAPTIFSGLIARSASMLRIFRLIEHLSESDATVLVTGESGTGKELIARAVHVHSPRSRGPFIAVNCGALPGELLESELFGHVRGAFTGAIRDRVGRFELAAGGTIFLDEVGDLPLPLQVKLLRVLQERTFERVGESTSRTTDARIIAATNKQLLQAVHDGQFRDDLYYRLRVVPIEIPPIRKRREDIEPLARHLLARVNRSQDRSVRLSPDAVRCLLRYHWPGNVRELENSLEYAVAVSRSQTLHPRDFPLEVTGSEHLYEPPAIASSLGPDPARQEPAAFPKRAAPAERATDPDYDRIRSALELHKWRRAEAAQALGMSRTTLWRKMREFDLLH